MYNSLFAVCAKNKLMLDFFFLLVMEYLCYFFSSCFPFRWMMWNLLLLMLKKTPCLNSISLLVTKQLECRPLICKTLHPCLHSPFKLSLSDSLSWANRSGSGTALIHNGQVQTKSHVWRDVFICMSVSPPVELVAGWSSASLYMQLVSGVRLSARWIGWFV